MNQTDEEKFLTEHQIQRDRHSLTYEQEQKLPTDDKEYKKTLEYLGDPDIEKRMDKLKEEKKLVKEEYKQERTDLNTLLGKRSYAPRKEKMWILHKEAQKEEELRTWQADKEELKNIKKKAESLFWDGKGQEAEGLREQYNDKVIKINEQMYTNYKEAAKPFLEKMAEIDERKKELLEKLDKAVEKGNKKEKAKIDLLIDKIIDEKKNLQEQLNKETETGIKAAKELYQEEQHRNLIQQQAEGEEKRQEDDTLKEKKKRQLISFLSGLATGTVTGVVVTASGGTLLIPFALLVGGPHVIGHFIKRKTNKLQLEIGALPDGDEKREKTKEFQQRLVWVEKYRQVSKAFTLGAGVGLVLGGLYTSAATLGGSTGLEAEASTSLENLAEIHSTDSNLVVEGSVVEVPETINVHDFAGGQEYTEYIEGLKNQGRLLGDNLQLTEGLGGSIGEIQGELLKTIHEAGIPTEQINGKVFMNQILEINKAIISNQPYNLQNMAQTVINASAGAI